MEALLPTKQQASETSILCSLLPFEKKNFPCLEQHNSLDKAQEEDKSDLGYDKAGSAARYVR
jgi:hypothetical protein